ncbi:hypothetical protein RJ639_023587 [Escallonia herrerae]|uniref:START domain-containing protein n=1 Tax=Escallonia herrerae TaxID=1293975 RepID=A0AA88UZU5_9ASTE|nr:hypothetical protein RJ639_023587 [Escallonia herrerae]
MALISAILEILQRPTIGDVLTELMMLMTPLWIAVFVGVLVGWAWRPKWANLIDSSKSKGSSDSSPISSFSGLVQPLFSTGLGSIPGLNSLKMQLPSCISWTDGDDDGGFHQPSLPNSDCRLVELQFSFDFLDMIGSENSAHVTENDLEHICRLVEEKDGGPAWIQMMDRSTETMSYQAWRRDPENGPPQYRSRSVYEDATPEMMRDFFWDDDSRKKWDDMLIDAQTLEECPTTGTMVVHWTRKFPFFCSDREYIIGRRIWESGRSYYCVTKGVPYPSVPRRNKPRRVDLYYSSWCIRAVESKREVGQLTACEVLLFHHEDMGIPWELAKLGVRQGMWGAVKKIDPGLRAYQRERASGAPLSSCAFMAQINTNFSRKDMRSLEATKSGSAEGENRDKTEKPLGRNIPKVLVVGGAIALACSLDRGLLTKAVIFGVARRFAKIGKRL